MINIEKFSKKEIPSDSQLMRFSIIAVFIWLVIYFCIVLPAEYGIDPSGLGNVFDLTEMGRIKIKLIDEANNEQHSFNKNILSNDQSRELTKSTGENEDAFKLVLKPDEAIEIKLEMEEGKLARYRWSTKGGGLNYNLHGDGYRGSKRSITYKKGRKVESDSGKIKADFDGYHGWFWRNRNKANVTVFLDTEGDYIQVKRMK